MELLCDNHHGVYIPQIMARRLYDAGWAGITLDDVVELEADPYEGEWYWETWNDILNSAVYTDENGQQWYLYHDCDLWAVTQKDFDEMGDF